MFPTGHHISQRVVSQSVTCGFYHNLVSQLLSPFNAKEITPYPSFLPRMFSKISRPLRNFFLSPWIFPQLEYDLLGPLSPYLWAECQAGFILLWSTSMHPFKVLGGGVKYICICNLRHLFNTTLAGLIYFMSSYDAQLLRNRVAKEWGKVPPKPPASVYSASLGFLYSFLYYSLLHPNTTRQCHLFPWNFYYLPQVLMGFLSLTWLYQPNVYSMSH